jgi:5-methylcytosine-specific restriction endonuclease McrA
MRAYKLDHLSDAVLLHALTALIARERATTADLLAHIAEVDARRLYAPAGYPSMVAYCVGEFRLSDDSAFRRIRAVRTARRFPAIFAEVAEGRLSLTAVILLTPYLTRENAAGLLKAAVHRSRSEVEELLARRFPRPDLLPMVDAVAGTPAHPDQLAPAPVENGTPELATRYVSQLAPAPVWTPRSAVTPSAPWRFALHVTIGGDTHEKLRHAQALLSHRIPSGDLASVLDLALDALVEKLEKRKCARTDTPRPRRRRASSVPRHIPAHVRRAVWERDAGRCTFVGDNGHRCNAGKFLEYDHIEPVARGGQATVAGVRLRCRVHNQLEAERTFGAGFMDEKRDAARRAAEARKAAETRAVVESAEGCESRDDAAPAMAPLPCTPDDATVASPEIMACLRTLGVRTDQARRAIELSARVPASTLEGRVRAALQFLGPKPRRLA